MMIGNFFKHVESKYKNHNFSGLCFDSSKCKNGNIFFAIKGTMVDGNQFINHAIQKGAKTIISSQKFEGLKKNILYIKSSNVRKLLSETAYAIYKNKPNNIIAVTGTNGKSSIADFYFQILRLNKKKVASIGTLGIKKGNQIKSVSNTTLDPIELSKALNQLKKENINDVILEASSHGLKQNRLDGLTFKTGIFTNLSHDHLDYHKTFENYLNSKLYLFKKLLKKDATVIVDSKIKQYKKIKNIAIKNKLNILTISTQKSNLEIISHQYHNDEQIIKIRYNKKIYKFQTTLVGKIQIKNILMAMLAANKSNISFNQIVNIINKIKPVDGRLQHMGIIKNNSKVILDYAHTPEALKTCLVNLRDQFKYKKISIVFGCGGNRDKAKRPMMGKIANQYCEKIYLTDDNPREENPKTIRASIKKNISKSKIYEISNRAEAIKRAVFDLKTGDILVVAGKGHENTQEYGKIKKLFSDQKEIKKNIKIKNQTLSNNLKLNILKELSNSSRLSTKLKFKNASINSKEINKNDIFFAIKGKNKDGNLFIKEAFKNGASLAVTDKFKNDKKQIRTKDTLKFLTEASSILRENNDSKIIAITGSSGKTSLKELIGKSLNKICNTTYSPKSFNNKFGVPLSLFNLRKNDNFGIFEVAMDKKGEIDFLSKVIKPDVGVITNISYAHIKNFKNIKEIALAKSEIIQNIREDGYLVLNADDSYYNFHKKIALKRKLNIFSFSIKDKSSNIYLNSIKKEKSKYKVLVNINNLNKHFYLSTPYENDIKNLLAAIAIISIFKDIRKLDNNIFFKYQIPNGRGDVSRIKLSKKNIYLIDQSYNANPLSMNSALKNFDMIKVNPSKKHLILGDMLELGKHSKKLHLAVFKNINKTSIKNVNVIGKHMSNSFRILNKNKKGLILKNNSEIINLINNTINNNDYLMIKGSNSTGLNKLTSDIKKRKINAL
jgi:murE/murF fusion protein